MDGNLSQDLCQACRVDVGIMGGTGPAGRGLALRFAAGGMRVAIGSRDPDKAAGVAKDLVERWPDRTLGLEGVDNATAARAEIVVVATSWDGAEATVARVAEELAGKVVICVANAMAHLGGALQPLTLARGSVAQGVAAAAPGALVATAFQHIAASKLANLDEPVEADVLICSDHPRASAVAAQLVSLVPNLGALEAGKLSNSGAIEAFTSVLVALNRRYKTQTSVRITGLGQP